MEEQGKCIEGPADIDIIDFVDIIDSVNRNNAFDRLCASPVSMDYFKEDHKPKTQVCSVLTVTIRDEEKSLRSKNLLYDAYTIDSDDPIIKDCIARALKDFGAEPSDIKVRINLEIL